VTPDLDAITEAGPEIRTVARLLHEHWPSVMSEDQYAAGLTEWLLDHQLAPDLAAIAPGTRVWFLYTLGLKIVRSELSEQEQHREESS
jgi:hypothetical protein